MAPMYVLAHAQWGVLAAILIILNSRCGCIISFTHAIYAAIGTNMHSIKPLFFKIVKWQYEAHTPYYKFPSPCLPKKEFLESELDQDKSEAFSDEFFQK